MKILAFVEDPGAANYVAPLPPILNGRNIEIHIVGVGTALGYLKQQGLPIEDLRPDVRASQLLRKHQPDLVMVGTAESPDTLGLPLIDAAREAGIPSVGIIDAYANADVRFRGRSHDPLRYAPDWLLIPDDRTQAAFVQLGYDARRTIICGHPHYDHIRSIGHELERTGRAAIRMRLLPNAPVSLPIIVFGTETPSVGDEHLLPAKEFTLTGITGRTRRTEIVLEEFLAAVCRLPERPYLVLRLHPKERTDDYPDFLTYFDCVSQGGRPLELLYCADLVVGLSSMLLLEAAIIGRPTFSILPRESDRDWLPTIRSGHTSCVTTRADLLAAFPQMVESCRRSEVADLGGTIRFGSTGIIIDFLLRLAQPRQMPLAA